MSWEFSWVGRAGGGSGWLMCMWVVLFARLWQG